MNPLEVFMKKIDSILNGYMDMKDPQPQDLVDLFDLRTTIQGQLEKNKSIEDFKKYYNRAGERRSK
jgi:hypothetical protein